MPLKERLGSGLPFVLYRHPKQQEIRCIFQNSTELHEFSEFKQTDGFLFFPYQAKENLPKVVLQNDFSIRVGKSERETLIASAPIQKGFVESSQKILGKEGFIEGVNKIKESIQRGKLTKAILSRVERFTIQDDFSPTSFFFKLCACYPNPYIYLFFHPKVGIWLGASPERVLEWKQKKIKTSALAATKSACQDQARAWTDKEKNEFLIVEKFVHETVKKHPCENIQIDGPYDQKIANLIHLKTNFSFDALSDFSLKNFLADLHPTPAIAGFPRKEAFEVLRPLEIHQREYFAGFFGSVSGEDEGCLYVNLRCMKIFQDFLEIHTGCGITADSDAQVEWQESVEKQKTLLNQI